jgi:hypothetical protein
LSPVLIVVDTFARGFVGGEPTAHGDLVVRRDRTFFDARSASSGATRPLITLPVGSARVTRGSDYHLFADRSGSSASVRTRRTSRCPRSDAWR